MGEFFFKGVVLAIALLVTGIALVKEDGDGVVYFAPVNGIEENASSTKRIVVVLETKKPANAVSGVITYPQEDLEVNIVEETSSFINIWVQKPSNNATDGVIQFAGGTSNKSGLATQGTILTLTITPRTEKSAELRLSDVQVLSNDGKGTPLTVLTRSYIINEEKNQAVGGVGNTTSVNMKLEEKADFDGDGKITLVDLSILMTKSIGTFDSQYDLNNDGAVGLGDLSSLLSILGK